MKGCKTNYVIFSLSDPFAQKKAFTQWSWDVQLESNQIEYIVGKLYNDVNENQGFWDAAFSGKFGIQDSNIHMYCKNNTSDLIPGYLVSLDSNTQEVSIKNWVLGDKLYGMALDTINPGDYGTVQHSGILKIYADAITPILFNSPLELNSGGHLTPHLSGHIVGYAMESLDSGIGVIKIKMV